MKVPFAFLQREPPTPFEQRLVKCIKDAHAATDAELFAKADECLKEFLATSKETIEATILNKTSKAIAQQDDIARYKLFTVEFEQQRDLRLANRLLSMIRGRLVADGILSNRSMDMEMAAPCETPVVHYTRYITDTSFAFTLVWSVTKPSCLSLL
jgi:hypothetical protein